MPYASQSLTRMPAACAPCARPVTCPRLLCCGEIVPSWGLWQQKQELFHRNFLLVFLGWSRFGLVKYRRTWERMGSGGLRGPQNRCEACKTSWMCSIHIRSRHTLPALLCSRSAACRKGAVLFLHGFAVPPALSATVSGFVCRVSSMPMEVFCRMTTVRRVDLSCVVQAGGLSSRMGRDKARMTFCGEPLIERVLGRLATVAGELVVTTSRPSELAYLEERTFGGLVPRIVSDLEGPAGAMRGIASSLAAARLPFVAIVACDMPFVSSELIGALAGCVEAEALDVCVPREERGIEPLCAVWRRDACAPVAQELLACDRQRIRCLINRVQAGYMDEPQIVKVAARRSASRTSIRPRSLRRPSCSPRSAHINDGRCRVT